MEKALEIQLQELLLYYCNNVRPLLLELKLRRSDKSLAGINNEIRALNDHIARCYHEEYATPDFQKLQLNKAEGHMRRLILDCFKQLNMDIFSKIEICEKRYFSDLWLRWGTDGKFWKEYSNHRKEAQMEVLSAKKLEMFEPEESLRHYENAFQYYRKLERMLDGKKAEKALLWSWIYRHLQFISDWAKFIISTLILSIISSIIGVLIG